MPPPPDYSRRDADAYDNGVDSIRLRSCGVSLNRFHGVKLRDGILLHRDEVLPDVGEVRPHPRKCLDGRFRIGPTRMEYSYVGTESVPTRTGSSYLRTASPSM